MTGAAGGGFVTPEAASGRGDAQGMLFLFWKDTLESPALKIQIKR